MPGCPVAWLGCFPLEHQNDEVWKLVRCCAALRCPRRQSMDAELAQASLCCCTPETWPRCHAMTGQADEGEASLCQLALTGSERLLCRCRLKGKGPMQIDDALIFAGDYSAADSPSGRSQG